MTDAGAAFAPALSELMSPLHPAMSRMKKSHPFHAAGSPRRDAMTCLPCQRLLASFVISALRLVALPRPLASIGQPLSQHGIQCTAEVIVQIWYLRQMADRSSHSKRAAAETDSLLMYNLKG